MDNIRTGASCSQAFRPKNLKQDVKTSRVKNMTIVGTRVVVNASTGNALKKSTWVWKPKRTFIDHVSKEKIFLHDHAVVDSGCSSHMTGNKAYLSDYEDYNGGFMAFGSDPKGGKITKSTPTAHTYQVFDDVDVNDAMDYMKTEDAHYEERTSAEKGVSTEDKVSTDKPKVSTDKPEVSTDQLDVSTDKPDEGTAKAKDGDSEESATLTDPTTTSIPTKTVFRDDETIAEFLVSMSQNKAKQKGVEIKDAED
ncbi:hypothetical protein Tco_1378627 [Tanacetum coccineum]